MTSRSHEPGLPRAIVALLTFGFADREWRREFADAEGLQDPLEPYLWSEQRLSDAYRQHASAIESEAHRVGLAHSWASQAFATDEPVF